MMAKQTDTKARSDHRTDRENGAPGTSDAQLRRLFELAMDPLGVVGFDGYIRHTNPAFAGALGYSAQELKSRPFMEFVHPDDVAKTAREIEKLATGEPTITFENRFLGADGASVHISWTARPDVDEGLFYVVGRNISDLRRAERLAQDNERWARAVTAAAPDAIFTLTRDGIISAVNPAGEAMFGYPASDLIGMSAARLVPGRWRNQLLASLAPDLESGISAFVGTSRRGTGVRKDGVEFPLELSASPVALNGESAFLVHVRDETDRLATKKAERESEDRFRAITETVLDGIITIDEHGIVQSFNPQASQIFGYQPEEVIGNNIAMLMPEPVSSNHSGHIQRYVRTGIRRVIGMNSEMTGRRKDGSIFPMELAVSETTFRNQRLFVGVVRDISERRKAEQEIRVRGAALEAAADAIVIVNRDGVIEYVNDSLVRQTGYTREEVVGQTLRILMSDRQDSAFYDDRWESVLSGQAWNGVVTNMRKDGSHYSEEISITPIVGADGEVTHLVSIKRDVTERKRAEDALAESEERLRDLFDNANDLIQSVDIDGRFVFTNRAWREALGYTEDEVASLTIRDVIHPDSLEQYMGVFYRGFAGEDVTSHAMFITKQGRTIDVEGNLSVRTVNGKAVATRGIFRDVTERREIDRMKDEFISVVSHELRTPLTSIRGSLGLLAGGVVGELPPKATDMLGIAVANTDRLIRLINGILNLERIESGEVELEREEVPAIDLIASAIDSVEAMATCAGVSIVAAQESTPLIVDADFEAVVQVLTNLLSNAVKFTDEHTEVVISIKARGEEALFAVADKGRGIPADSLESIFGRFQQVDASDSRAKGGTGLGLAISKQIIERHDGRIWAESALGEGSTFYFTLPLASVAHGSKVDSGGRAPKVLICDDDASVRTVVRVMVEDAGFSSAVVSSGRACVNAARDFRPSVILLDMLMPGGMSGWDTIAALQSDAATKYIPVVVFSVIEPTATGSAEFPVVDWVVKPDDNSRLLDALADALQADRGEGSVLLVEDDPDLTRVLTALLERHGIVVTTTGTKKEAIDHLQSADPDLVILDLGLPDGSGLEVVDWLRENNRMGKPGLVVHTGLVITPDERERIEGAGGEIHLKADILPAQLEARVMDLLRRIAINGQKSR